MLGVRVGWEEGERAGKNILPGLKPISLTMGVVQRSLQGLSRNQSVQEPMKEPVHRHLP